MLLHAVVAIEYAKNNIRFNAVAPGQVDTLSRKTGSKVFLEDLFADGYDLQREGYR